MGSEDGMKMAGAAGACFCVAVIVTLIVVLGNLRSLSPNEQLLVMDPNGYWVQNGPYKGVIITNYDTEYRSVYLLTKDMYATLKDKRTGELRHEEGPQRLFLEPYDEIVSNSTKTLLKFGQYAVLQDRQTGEIRHELGPQLLKPGVFDDVHVETNLVLAEGEYASLKDRITGVKRQVPGPTMVQPGIYEDVMEVSEKIILQKDEYIRLINNLTGVERVVPGEQTVVPEPLEISPTGKQKALFLDTDSAALVVNRTSGQQRLVTKHGAFMPAAYEAVLEVRELIHVLPHEAVVVRDGAGQLRVMSGADGSGLGTSFFLDPYMTVFKMTWSSYSSLPADDSPQVPGMRTVEKIDLRARKVFFRYEVQTSDNVKLSLEGTVFWKILVVSQMIMATDDPEGDVWHHARNALTQAVSNATLSEFMTGFNGIVKRSFDRDSSSSFYTDRGLELQSMELTRFDCTDPETSKILQEIIQETTNKINKLTAQESENQVKEAALLADIKLAESKAQLALAARAGEDQLKAAELAAEISLEQARTELIRTQTANQKLAAEMAGESTGVQLARGAAMFIEGLNESVPNISTRVDLYRMHNQLEHRNLDTQHLSSGSAHLFLTPEDLKLKLEI